MTSIGYHRVGLVPATAALLQTLALPLASAASLAGSVFVFGLDLNLQQQQLYISLGIVAFLLSYAFTRPNPSEVSGAIASGWKAAEKHAFAWVGVVLLLLVLGYATKTSSDFSRRAIFSWFLITPAISVGIWMMLRLWLRHLLLTTGASRSVVIAGINEGSRRLAQNMREHPEYGLSLDGFFDDRRSERVGDTGGVQHLGVLEDLPAYVRDKRIDIIFIAIPISHVDRMQTLLHRLNDTTASVYYIPDIFVAELIQSRSDEIKGVHVLALCESPYYGWRGILKRLSDLVLASTMLIVAAPAMLLIAVAIKLTTPGSIIFRQRRYGLDGEEFVVYKFRTMTTSDDGTRIAQAQAEDARVTRVGRILRRTSLDELPQLINVIQGRMSVVGPRPHAVAHNEMYRKLIKGYMIRHKVPPGITGLAQVSGCRGETADVTEMERRIRYDLQYLRDWSLRLDIRILIKTAKVMFVDRRAY